MKVTCGKCGKKTEEGAFCEKCGEPLEKAVPAEAAPVAEAGSAGGAPTEAGGGRPAAAVPGGGDGRGGSGTGWTGSVRHKKPLLEVDRMCVQFEGMRGTVRFRLDPGAEEMENVRLTLEHAGQGKFVCRPRRFRERGEIRVELAGQPAGWPTWTVRLEYEKNGKKLRWEGDVDLVVARPREAQRVADSLKVEITNHINLGNASDAHVNQRALDGLEGLSKSENPFDELRRVVCGSGRSWSAVELYETAGPPAGAARDRVVVAWGGWTVRVFAGPEVRFGRDRPGPEGPDFTMRPGPGGLRDGLRDIYLQISRLQCTFVRSGGGVEIRDGVRSDSGLQCPSKYGTWWEGKRLRGTSAWLASGVSGMVSFGGASDWGSVGLRAECGPGWLLLRREDGVKEAFLMLWGEFGFAKLDSAAGDLQLCRQDGAFSWQSGGQSGWIVPGASAGTPVGWLGGV